MLDPFFLPFLSYLFTVGKDDTRKKTGWRNMLLWTLYIRIRLTYHSVMRYQIVFRTVHEDTQISGVLDFNRQDLLPVTVPFLSGPARIYDETQNRIALYLHFFCGSRL